MPFLVSNLAFSYPELWVGSNPNQYKYVKEFHFYVIFLAKKFVLSMIIRIFAALVPAEPLYNA